jgi:hypothetical protein
MNILQVQERDYRPTQESPSSAQLQELVSFFVATAP